MSADIEYNSTGTFRPIQRSKLVCLCVAWQQFNDYDVIMFGTRTTASYQRPNDSRADICLILQL